MQTHLTRRTGVRAVHAGLAGLVRRHGPAGVLFVRGNSYKAGVGGECALATALDVSIMGVLL